MIVMIDNFDSFTYNIYQAVCEMGADVRVYRNNAITIPQIEELKPESIIVSPGPGTPQKAGISMDVIRHFMGRMPILGVCLGHQSIGAVMGARIKHAGRVMHGKLSSVNHTGEGLFAGLPQGFKAVRYHSLVVDETTLPAELIACAHSDDGEIMGLMHAEYPLFGVQFHPESIAAQCGVDILRKFITLTQEGA